MRTTKSETRTSGAAREQPDWAELLVSAVTTPGVISAAYSRFWNYSIGNQLLALVQCLVRRIEPGPIHTFLGWKELGRHVKRGEKALTLCMPVTVKSSPRADVSTVHEKASMPLPDDEDGNRPVRSRTRFVYRPHWFVLSQTEGKEYQPAELPTWSETRALDAMGIERVAFHHTDGNAQGYATGRQVAVSPIAFMPARTLLHELAHVVLGHTDERQRMDDDDSSTPRDLREVEAECVALLCCAALDLGGEAFSRGYIQHWLCGQPIPERSARKVFSATDQILRAGRPTAAAPSTPV